MSFRLTPSLALLLVGFTGAGVARRAGDPLRRRLKKPRPPTAQERAILAVDEAFVRAYNNGDAKAWPLCSPRTPRSSRTDGLHYQGRELLAKSLAETFEANKGAKIAFDVESIRFLTPDSAKEEGRSIITPVKGPAVSRPYTVLYVRRDGRWLIADVHEEPDPVVTPHDRLEELSWLIGDWLDEGRRRRRPDQLPMVGGRQFPDPDVPCPSSGQGRDVGRPADRLGPAWPSRSDPGSSTRKGGTARADGPATATAGSSSNRASVPRGRPRRRLIS